MLVGREQLRLRGGVDGHDRLAVLAGTLYELGSGAFLDARYLGRGLQFTTQLEPLDVCAGESGDVYGSKWNGDLGVLWRWNHELET